MRHVSVAESSAFYAQYPEFERPGRRLVYSFRFAEGSSTQLACSVVASYAGPKLQTFFRDKMTDLALRSEEHIALGPVRPRVTPGEPVVVSVVIWMSQPALLAAYPTGFPPASISLPLVPGHLACPPVDSRGLKLVAALQTVDACATEAHVLGLDAGIRSKKPVGILAHLRMLYGPAVGAQILEVVHCANGVVHVLVQRKHTIPQLQPYTVPVPGRRVWEGQLSLVHPHRPAAPVYPALAPPLPTEPAPPSAYPDWIPPVPADPPPQLAAAASAASPPSEGSALLPPSPAGSPPLATGAAGTAASTPPPALTPPAAAPAQQPPPLEVAPEVAATNAAANSAADTATAGTQDPAGLPDPADTVMAEASAPPPGGAGGSRDRAAGARGGGRRAAGGRAGRAGDAGGQAAGAARTTPAPPPKSGTVRAARSKPGAGVQAATAPPPATEAAVHKVRRAAAQDLTYVSSLVPRIMQRVVQQAAASAAPASQPPAAPAAPKPRRPPWRASHLPFAAPPEEIPDTAAPPPRSSRLAPPPDRMAVDDLSGHTRPRSASPPRSPRHRAFSTTPPSAQPPPQGGGGASAAAQ